MVVPADPACHRRSFPSGHSSLSWAGLWFLTLYLAGKMKVYDTKGFSLKTWILLLPVMAAALVSVSRSMDYRCDSLLF